MEKVPSRVVGEEEKSTEVCIKSPAHALVAALALLSEGSPVANNLLEEYR